MTAPDPLQIVGQLVAEKYRIEQLVGEGGFAVVYRAQHIIWNKPVAIKFFNGLSSAPIEQREELQRTFIQEGALLTELSSQTAGIVQARDVGACITPSGQWIPYLVLEWLEGSSLDRQLEAERIARLRPWSVAEVLGLLARMLPALEVAHARGVAHRDIKPANLFVLGATARSLDTPIKILDFGVAKMVSDISHLKAASAKTGASISSFTPQYGAPEQFTRSFGATGPWTDVYAVALVAVELLHGAPALEGDDLVQLGFATANAERRPTPRSLGVELPDVLEAVFRRALAVNPRERYASAGEFQRALDVSVGAAASERPPAVSAPERNSASPAAVTKPEARAVPRRSWGGWLLVGASLLGVGYAALELREPEARQRASVQLSTWVNTAQGVANQLGVGASNADGTANAPHPTQTEVPQHFEPPSDGVVGSGGPAAGGPAAGVAHAVSCPQEMVLIAGATTQLGDDTNVARDDEKPAHRVTLTSYCLDRNEVTAAEYRACLASGRCKRPERQLWWPGIEAREREIFARECNLGRNDRAEHPMNCVSWTLAETYCRVRGKRLPSEAEWEYAARGDEPRNYTWGHEEPTARRANLCGSECGAWAKLQRLPSSTLHELDDGYPTTAPVGAFPSGASPFGVNDLAGNVWEWVRDWYAPYGSDPEENPTGPAEGTTRVIRGGGFETHYASWLRPSFREARPPRTSSPTIGFRCAKAASEEASEILPND